MIGHENDDDDNDGRHDGKTSFKVRFPRCPRVRTRQSRTTRQGMNAMERPKAALIAS